MNCVSASTQYCSVLHRRRGWGLGMFLGEWSDWWFSTASISSVWSLSGTSLQCEYDLWQKIVKCLTWQVFTSLESWITHIQFVYFPEVLMIYVDNGSLYWLPAIRSYCTCTFMFVCLTPMVRVCCNLQMRVTARDLGTPQLSSAPIDVSIFVVRNNNPPVFVNLPYTTQIEETSNIGRFVYRVTTTDADQQVR